MRNVFIAILPVMLVACGASGTQTTEAPKPAPAAQPKQAEQKAAPPKTRITETAGTWTKTSNGISPMVVYASAEGEPLFSAACIAGNEDTGGPLLELKSVSSGDEAANIDIFTSAGNARVSAGADRAPGTSSGMTETVSQAAYVLAGGAGEIKVVSGTRGITFETNQMLEDLIEDCRPAFKAEVKSDEADTETEEGEEAKDAAEEETPSGT